uniref:THAP-type domain-containing protein n=1 Tax=Sparus aurata TaxID=8175 RepID=A0A671W0Z0_SPAAU
MNIYFPGSQATASTKSVTLGDTTFQFLPLQSSTPLKRKAKPENPPTKRPHLEFPSIPESEPSVSFVDPDDSSYLPMSEPLDTTSEQAPTKPVQDMVKYLVYEECLLELFKICPTCSTVCKIETFVKVTFLSVTQKCLHQSCFYSRQWKSQPLLGSSPAGNLHLSAAVYYTGSSFIQTNKVLNAMHVRTFSRMTHHNHVHNYILASVLHKWQSHQTDQLEELKQRETVSLAGDMRADSTGHFAKYGSYSLMDLKTKLLISNFNEVESSVRMEKEGLIRSLDFLEKSGVKVASLVTDRHTQVQKFILEQKPNIDHFYDVWHFIYYLRWMPSPRRRTVTVAKWTSLLNHIQNIHVPDNPLFPECLHAPSNDKKKWLKPATKPTYRLEKVLMNKHILSDVKKLSPLYQTSTLEGFNGVILHFAPKNVAFSYLGMLCRLIVLGMNRLNVCICPVG